MCGISGIFAYRDPDRVWSIDKRQTLLDFLAHRGPDDKGGYTEPGIYLAHTRLAVLDLSSNARQPMISQSGRYVVTFNGEIYNFREIRVVLERDGIVFRSDSDTEVLAEAWSRWQHKCLDRLDGMFAFAIYDRLQRALYLVRDQFGIKPLFFSDVMGELRFASEPLPLVKAFDLTPTLVPEDLDVYFTFSYLAAPRTGISEVSQLPAGHFLKVTCEGIQISRYWKIRYSESEVKDGSCEQFEELLSLSVRQQLVSDVPLGVFLSGGIDSSAVSLFASQERAGLNSFTLGFAQDAFDESSDALLLGESLGLETHVAQFSWTAEEIALVLGAISELLADSSCYPIYQLARFARKRITVALSGDGGDELLAGYRTYQVSRIFPYLRLLSPVVRDALRSGVRRARFDSDKPYGLGMVLDRLLLSAGQGQYKEHASLRHILSPDLKRRLYSSDFLGLLKGFDPLEDYVKTAQEAPASRSYLTRLLHGDFAYHLPSILAKVDRMSMAHGLEVRVPFLNPAMVQFCANMPDDAKMRGRQGKRVLRSSIKGRVPSRILRKSKTGFLPPVDRWFREAGGAMDEVFSDYLPAGDGPDILNWKEVRKLWREHKLFEADAGFVLLNMLHFLNWRKKWGV